MSEDVYVAPHQLLGIVERDHVGKYSHAVLVRFLYRGSVKFGRELGQSLVAVIHPDFDGVRLGSFLEFLLDHLAGFVRGIGAIDVRITSRIEAAFRYKPDSRGVNACSPYASRA